MDPSMYAAIQKGENSWWYEGRMRAIKALLQRFPPSHGSVLDLGAGYGAMHPLLSCFGPVTAFEIDPHCIKACASRGYVSVVSETSKLFHPLQPYNLVGAFDVLEHIEEDISYLLNLRKAMAKNAFLVATVPAHPWLWSQYDVEARHFRRHTKKSFRSLMEQINFDILYLGYWNCALFIPAALMRFFGIGGKETLSPRPMINNLLKTIVYLEAKLLSCMSLPIGLSLLAIGRKKD